MTPMTIAEFIKQDSITGRRTSIDFSDQETPFTVQYYQAGFTSKVVLTDLPQYIRDLPQKSRERAWCAYLVISEQWAQYLTALRSRQDYTLIDERDKKQRETRELLERTMAPKEYLAAIQAVHQDQPGLDERIAKRIAAVESGLIAA